MSTKVFLSKSIGPSYNSDGMDSPNGISPPKTPLHAKRPRKPDEKNYTVKCRFPKWGAGKGSYCVVDRRTGKTVCQFDNFDQAQGACDRYETHHYVKGRKNVAF